MTVDAPVPARLLARIVSPIEEFLRSAAAGGIVLLAATAAALVAATWHGAEPLHHAWAERLAIFVPGRLGLDLTLHQWVNEGLMTLFFLVVGLELKREILVGELASWKDGALPMCAALGGMIFPAAIYLAMNHGTPDASGWGIATATDIAFAIGILVLLGKRVPRNLVVFLTALAIADDLGAVILIAAFYSAFIDWRWVHAAGALFVLLLIFNRGGLRHPLAYVVVGALLWYALLRSGVHATIAGVVTAIAIPSRPAYSPAQFERRLAELGDELHRDRRDPATPDDPLRNPRMAEIASAVQRAGSEVQSPLQRIEHALTPWVAFAVVPLFAFANAGIDLRAVQWSQALSGITIGVAAGLVLGKFAGVGLFSWLAVRFGFARLPTDVRWPDLLGAAWLAGIGFTMSLFIAQLAFTTRAQVDEARLGILLASAVAGVIGLAWLLFLGRRRNPAAI